MKNEYLVLDEALLVIDGVTFVSGKRRWRCLANVDLELLFEELDHFQVATVDSEVNRIPHRRFLASIVSIHIHPVASFSSMSSE